MDATIGVTFDGHHRIELVQGEDRTIQMAFRDQNTDTPIDLSGGIVTVRLPGESDTPILRSSGPVGGSNGITPNQVSIAGELFTVANHGLLSGDPVTLQTNGTLPAPLLVGTTYYASAIDEDHFQLTDSGGNVLNLTTVPVGNVLVTCGDVVVDQPSKGLATLNLRAAVTAQLQADDGQSFMIGLNIGGKQRYVIASNELDVEAAPD